MLLYIISPNDIWGDFASIKTPLALAGLFAAVVFLIARQILKNYQPKDPNKRHGFQLARTILMYLFILSLVGMLLGFLGYWFPPSKPLLPDEDLTASERAVLRLKDEANFLLSSFTNIDESPADWKKTTEEGPKLVELLLLINDDQLRPAYRLVKYECAMYVTTMVAVTEPNKEPKLRYASEALDLGRKTEELVADVKRNYVKNKEYERAMGFVVNDSVDDRVHYLTATCLCQQAGVSGNPDLMRQVNDRIAKVSRSFLEKYPVETNADFNPCNEGGLTWRKSKDSH
ncbi:MAG TPA: hypothetical protein VN843_04830 [Anaerolineales bacterium]|nr:hypothetical protein [Anaerolineales bacterium]